MKVHYNNALRYEANIIPICRIRGDMIPATKVPSLVTCGNCRKRMGHPPAPETLPEPAIFFMFRGEILPWGGVR